MRKLFAVSLIVSFIAGSLLLVGGCGQTTPTINTSNPQPQGLKLKGVIRSTTLNNTLGDPIAGAYVTLSGDSVNKTVLTNSSGEYVIENVPDGSYNLIVTAEGHIRNSTTAVGVAIKPSSNIPADNTITVTDIQLFSNPIVLSYSPIPMSVVSNRPSFVVTFNEIMDATSVVPTLASANIRTMVAGPSTVPLSGSWDSTTSPRILTLTPQADLISNETYTLTVNGTAMDAAGYQITNAGDQSQALLQSYRVTTGGVPGAPGNVSVVIGTMPITSDAATGPDFANIFGGGTNVGIYWTPSTGVVTGYRVYVANSAAGNYHLIAAVSPTTNFTDPTMANIITALYGGSTVDPLGTANYPMINQPLYVKVVAFNGDGESAAATANAIELVGPQIDTTTYKKYGFAAAVMNNNNVLPAIDVANKRVVYIGLKEPVQISTIAGNFSLTAGGGTSIVGATLLTQSSGNLSLFGGGTDVFAIVKIETSTDMDATTQITIGSGVKDLAGNSISLNGNAAITLGGF